jgi:hypothetical protein
LKPFHGKPTISWEYHENIMGIWISQPFYIMEIYLVGKMWIAPILEQAM